MHYRPVNYFLWLFRSLLLLLVELMIAYIGLVCWFGQYFGVAWQTWWTNEVIPFYSLQNQSIRFMEQKLSLLIRTFLSWLHTELINELIGVQLSSGTLYTLYFFSKCALANDWNFIVLNWLEESCMVSSACILSFK